MLGVCLGGACACVLDPPSRHKPPGSVAPPLYTTLDPLRAFPGTNEPTTLGFLDAVTLLLQATPTSMHPSPIILGRRPMIKNACRPAAPQSFADAFTLDPFPCYAASHHLYVYSTQPQAAQLSISPPLVPGVITSSLLSPPPPLSKATALEEAAN